MEQAPWSRLALVLDLSGASAREIDRLAGRAENQFALIISRKQRSLRGDIAAIYARVFGCSVGYLLAGEGDTPTREQVTDAIERARTAHAARLASSHIASDFALADDPRPSQAA